MRVPQITQIIFCPAPTRTVELQRYDNERRRFNIV